MAFRDERHSACGFLALPLVSCVIFQCCRGKMSRHFAKASAFKVATLFGGQMEAIRGLKSKCFTFNLSM